MKKLQISLTAIAFLLAGAAVAGTVRVPFEIMSASAGAGSGSTVTVAMGDLAVGMFGYKTITYTNTTSGYINVTNIDVNDPVSLYSGTCGLMAPGESCALTFAMIISQEGGVTGTAKIYATKDSGVVVDTFNFTANGVPASTVFSVTPNGAAFTFSGETKSFTLKNIQSFPVSVDYVQPSNKYWTVSNSTCAGVMTAGAECTFVAKYVATKAGANKAELKLFVDSIPYVSVPVSGSMVLGSPSFNLDQMSFTGSKVNIAQKKAFTLVNSGQGKLVINNVQMLGDSTFSISANDCPAILDPGVSCNLEIKSLFTAVNKSSNGTVQFSFSNAGQTTALVGVQGDSYSGSKTLGASPASLSFNPVLAGQTSTATLTLSSIGADAVTVTDATVSGAGSVSLNKSACLKKMAPGESCDIIATYTGAATDGSQTGTINIVSDSDPAVKVGYTGTTMSTSIAANPSTLSFVGDNSTSLTQTVTITNNGSFNTTVKSATIAGTYYSVGSNTCTAELAPGKTCTVDVKIVTPTAGSTAGSLALTYTSGTVTKSLNVPLTSNISGLGLTLSAFTCTTSDVGVDGTCSATLTNPSATSVNVTALTSDSKSFGTPTIVGATAFPVAVGSKQTKTISIPYKFTAEGSYSTNITVKNAVKDLVGVASVVTKTTASATATLSNFTCPTTALIGTPATCTANLTNTSSTKALAVGAITQSNSAFALTHNCTASLAASKSCVITLNITPSAAQTYSTDVTVVTNPTLTKTAALNASAANIEVTSPTPGKVSPGVVATYNVSYKNVGSVGVDLSKANKTVTGLGYSLVSTTCNSVLAVGQSCIIVSKFSSNVTASSLKGFANLDVAGKVYTGSMDTSVLQEKLTVNRMPGVTSFAGFRSGSGNKYTVTNLGIQAQTLNFTPAASTVIGFDSSDPSPCRANISLAPDKSCTFYDSVSATTMPTSSVLISGVGYVRGTSAAATASWSANYKMVPPSVVLTGLNNPANLSEQLSVVLKISNPTTSPLKNVSVSVASTPTTAKVTIGSASCLTSIEAGQTCDVPVSLMQPGTADIMLSLNFTISGAYATERNAAIIGTGEKVVQAKYTYSSKFSAPMGSWAIGQYPLTGRDQTTNATHTFTNTGTTTIAVSGIELQTAPSSNQAVFADNCTGQVLAPKKTCTVTTSFSVVSGVIEYKPADLVLTAASGHTWKGTIIANPTGEALVDISGTGCTGGMLYPVATSPSIKLNATLGSAYTCLVSVKNVGGGYLNFGAPTVYLRQLSATPGETLNGQVPFDKTNPYSDYKAMSPIPQPVSLVWGNGSPYWIYSTAAKSKQTSVINTIFYEDGSRFTINPSFFVLAPGATVKIGVGVGYCTRVGARPLCIGKPGNYDFDMFINAGTIGATNQATGYGVVARYKLKFNMGAPVLETQSNANIPTTNLEGGQSVTYTFVNNDVEAIPIGVPFYNYWPNTGSIALNQYISSGYRKNLKTGVNEIYGVNGLDGFVTATNCTTPPATGTTPFVGAKINPGQSCYVRHSCLTDNDLGVSARNLALNAWQANRSSSKFVLEAGNRVSTRKPSDYITYLPDSYNPNGMYPGYSEVNFYPQLNGQSITTNSLKCTLQ